MMRSRFVIATHDFAELLSRWLLVRAIGRRPRSARSASENLGRILRRESARARSGDGGSGSAAARNRGDRKMRESISPNNWRLLGWKVTRQAFSDNTPRGKVEFVNLIATFAGKESAPSFLRLLALRHKGLRHGEIRGRERRRVRAPACCSNWRGSWLSVRIWPGKLQLVFFDGEEAYEAFSETDGLYGSRYFARQLSAENKTKQFRGGDRASTWWAIDRLTITLPPDSPAEMARDIFASAEALNLRKHFTYFDRDIMDDHTPLNAVGIPTIDLIDFDFPAWHTPEDTMDKLSAESLRVGRRGRFLLPV